MKPILVLAVCLVTTPAHAGEIEVTEPADIALVVAISDAVDQTTEEISTCIGDGGAHQSCLCAGAGHIAGVRDALGEALAVHPEWEDATLFLANKGDGQSLTLFLDTVAASAAPPDCG